MKKKVLFFSSRQKKIYIFFHAFILFKPEKLHSKKPNENGKNGSPFWEDFRNQSVFF